MCGVHAVAHVRVNSREGQLEEVMEPLCEACMAGVVGHMLNATWWRAADPQVAEVIAQPLCDWPTVHHLGMMRGAPPGQFSTTAYRSAVYTS